MRTVAKRFEHSPRELREHFPLLSQAISSRYKTYCEVRGKEKLKQQEEEVRQAILKIHSQGLYPSANRVHLLLSKPAIMRNPILLQLWHDMLQELGVVH